MTDKKIIIIGWQKLSRRSKTLSEKIGCRLYLIHYLKFKFPPVAPIKYVMQAVKTFAILFRERPDIVICENPPVFLPFTVFCYSRMSGCRYVIDSATGAFFDPKWKMFSFMFKWLARAAAVNIVTNEPLADIVAGWGAKAKVLEDCIPVIPETGPVELRKGYNVVVINTFSFDEPVAEIVKAAEELPGVNFYITGNTVYADKKIIASHPVNVVFTGFLKEPFPYFGYLRSCDAIMVLCTVDRTLCAGMYEAAAVGKPLIASDLSVVRGFFTGGAVYVKNEYRDIARGVSESRSANSLLAGAMNGFAVAEKMKWPQKLKEVLNDIAGQS